MTFLWLDYSDIFYFVECFVRGGGIFMLFHSFPNLLASSIISLSGMPVFIANVLQSSYSGTMFHTPLLLPDIFTRTVPYGSCTSFISRVWTKRIILLTLTPIVVISSNIY